MDVRASSHYRIARLVCASSRSASCPTTANRTVYHSSTKSKVCFAWNYPIILSCINITF